MRHLYLHVPFCRRRCTYCDFSIAVRKRIPAREYVDAVVQELRQVLTDPGRKPGDLGAGASDPVGVTHPGREPGAASTTTVTPANPEIKRLRRGKAPACGRSPGGSSETRQPDATMRSYSVRFAAG